MPARCKCNLFKRVKENGREGGRRTKESNEEVSRYPVCVRNATVSGTVTS